MTFTNYILESPFKVCGFKRCAVMFYNGKLSCCSKSNEYLERPGLNAPSLFAEHAEHCQYRLILVDKLFFKLYQLNE